MTEQEAAERFNERRRLHQKFLSEGMGSLAPAFQINAKHGPKLDSK